MFNRRILFIGVMILAAALVAPLVYAGDCGCKKKMAGKAQGLDEMFFHKAKMFLEKEEVLGLTEKQVKTVMDLKMAMKKEVIRLDAEIDILEIDVFSGLRQETVDVENLNSLIDKKYEIKKEKTRAALKAYAELKAVLTPEQKTKLKSLLGEKKDGKDCKMHKNK